MKKLRFASVDFVKELPSGSYRVHLTDIFDDKPRIAFLKLSVDEVIYLNTTETIPYVINRVNDKFFVCPLFVDVDMAKTMIEVLDDVR